MRNYDSEDLTFPTSRIRGLYNVWARRMSDRTEEYRHWEWMFETRYWEKTAGVQNGRYASFSDWGMLWTEVNKLYPFIMSYVSALHNPDHDVVVRRGTGTTGNADAAYETLRMWRHQIHIVQSLQRIDFLSTLYDGCGVKVWWDVKKRDLLRRVKAKVIPWWEVMTDSGVHNEDEATYIAHCYWMPLSRARREFNDPKLQGTPRRVDDRFGFIPPTTTPNRADSGQWQDREVRVVEFYNLEDEYVQGESDPNGNIDPNFDPRVPPADGTDRVAERGRMDVFLPDEQFHTKEGTPAESGWTRPRKSYPFQLRDANGDPVLPIKVSVLAARPGYPLDGRAQTPRVFDLNRELNYSRSMQGTAVRRDMPMFFMERDFLDDEARKTIRQGQYGALAEFDRPENGDDPRKKIFPVEMPNVPYDHTLYRREIMNDIETSSMQPPATRGRVTGATATEVLEANKGGQGEADVLITNKKAFLVDFYSTVILAIRKSMQAKGADAVLNVAVGPGESARVMDVTADDLDGDFWIEIQDGEPTVLHEERMLQRFLSFLGAYLPLAKEFLSTGNPTVAISIDEMVKRAGMPEMFLSKNMQGPPPGDGAEVPRGPGAGSAVPGSASTPAVSEGGMPGEQTGGGPQPESPQPPGIETGTTQNGVMPQQVM